MLWVLKRTVSFDHSKHMFKLMGKEINAILGAQTIFIWTYGIVRDPGLCYILRFLWMDKYSYCNNSKML